MTNVPRIIAEDTLVLFADLQTGIADLPLTVPPPALRRGVLALARLAKLFSLPIVVSAVPGRDGKPGVPLPELAQGLGAFTTHYRTTSDSFADAPIKAAIEATGRKTLLISGVATEVAVLLPALSAVAAGFTVFIVVDAAAGMSARTEDAALRRLTQAGGLTISVPTVAGELAGDFGKPVGQQAIEILFGMTGDDK